MNNYNEGMERGSENDYTGQYGMDNMYDPHYNNLGSRDRNRIIERRPWNSGREYERYADRDTEREYWDRVRDTSARRVYNGDDYRTMGQRGGYIREGHMGNYLHEQDYDYGTGNYGGQGMGRTAYDHDFTYARRGHSAGSANIRGPRFYDTASEPMNYHDNAHRQWESGNHDNRRDDIYARSDRYSSRGGNERGRYEGTNDRTYNDRDYTMHGERDYFGNDAYGPGVMGGYNDNFPEDQWYHNNDRRRQRQ
jgi:hypothetical protein